MEQIIYGAVDIVTFKLHPKIYQFSCGWKQTTQILNSELCKISLLTNNFRGSSTEYKCVSIKGISALVAHALVINESPLATYIYKIDFSANSGAGGLEKYSGLVSEFQFSNSMIYSGKFVGSPLKLYFAGTL